MKSRFLLPAVLTASFIFSHSFAAELETFSPANPPDMKPLANSNSPAHQAAKLFQHGINLGDYLEAPPPGWGVTVTANELAQMHAEGFDHVRVPIGWHRYASDAPEFTISSDIFARADFVVTNALANHLAVIINIHHFNELDQDPAGQTEKFIALWQQIARHYAGFPNTLAFELDNEPHEKATTALMNPIYARAISEIRKTNPHRAIFVEPGNWGNIEELKNLALPANDDNLIVSVHCYEPFHFTHQGTGWTGPDFKVKGIQFPGPPTTPLVPDASLELRPWVLDWIQKYNTLPGEKNPSGPSAFEGRLKYVRAWSDFYGRPVHLGEFGCYVGADEASRARFLSVFRRALDEQKIGWAMWDWSASFRYWDKKKNQPMPGVRAALFGSK